MKMNHFCFKTRSYGSDLTMVDGNLTKVTVKKTVYDFLNKKTIYTIETPNGEQHTVDNAKFYLDENEFRIGECVEAEISCKEILRNAGIPTHGIDEVECSVWRFINGEPVEVPVDIWSVTEINGKYTPDVTGEWYGSRIDCIHNNDYYYVDEKGERHERKSLYRHVKLNEKQEAIAKKLDAVMKEAMDNGMLIGFSNDYGKMYAMNCENLLKVVYEGEIDENEPRVYVDNMYKHARLVGRYDNTYFFGCDDAVVFKDED